MKEFVLPLLLSLLVFQQAKAQSNTYLLNGSARRNSCNCYTLTSEEINTNGSVWNSSKINLNTSFDFVFNVNLGCRDMDGADGIVFILQTVSRSVGRNGSGLGFAGVTPSIGIELDTWQNLDDIYFPENNLNDPPYDHISIMANGNVKHGNDLAGPVPASASSDNIEDCQWHLFRIQWEAGTHQLRTYFDNHLRLQTTIDLVKDIFYNDPMVYWGFSGATGGAFNIQQFCTALNPKFTTDTPTDTFCLNATVRFTDQSESFAPVQSYFWDFGDGTTSHMPNPPVHVFNTPGIYKVKHAITAKDGCNSDTITRVIHVGSTPQVNFELGAACFPSALPIQNTTTNRVGAVSEWNWKLDGVLASKNPTPVLDSIPVGVHQLQLTTASVYGCPSYMVSKTFVVKPSPQIQAVVKDGCAGVPVRFAATQTDGATTVTQWHWDFGDNTTGTTEQATHIYTASGNYGVQSWAVADNGCISRKQGGIVTINQAAAYAGKDTVVFKNVPFQLNGSGNGTFRWTPSTYLNNETIANPVVALNDDQVYELTVTTAEGCIAKDTVTIQVYKGSAIYVPNAFTPNGNGLNDRLKPVYTGIKKLDYFIIYNRWGQVVFSTSHMGGEWNGTAAGKPLPADTYIYMLKAQDLEGHTYQLKGTVTLIR